MVWWSVIFPVLFTFQGGNLKIMHICDHLEGWGREGGTETKEGGDMGICVYVELTHFVIQQKLTQHCKAIILQ